MKAAVPFLYGNALAEAGQEVQIFRLGEAVSAMRIPLENKHATVANPSILVQLIEWADKLLTE